VIVIDFLAANMKTRGDYFTMPATAATRNDQLLTTEKLTA